MLLANQQEDGDGLSQNIVKNLNMESRKGLTNGLRDFIKIDNERALDVGYLNRGLGTFQVLKPKVAEGHPEVTVRESPDELTLRAEEVGTSKTYINVHPIGKGEVGLPFRLITVCFPSGVVQRHRRRRLGESKTMRTKKCEEATGGPESKSPLEMKAAKDAGEEYFEPTREDNIRRRNETILALWEEHLKDPIVALDKALKCVEILRWRSRPECLAEGCLAMRGVGSLPLLWRCRSGRAFGPTGIRWTVCVCAQRPWKGMCQGSMGCMASSFSSSY